MAENNIIKIGNHALSRFKEGTLQGRYELAKKFIERFPIGEVILTETFDKWGIEIGEVHEVAPDLSIRSPEWRFRVDQRSRLKNEINLGGICDHFQDCDKFQIIINEQAKSLLVVQFLAFIDEETENFAVALDRSVKNRAKKIEKLISSCNYEYSTEAQRIKAVTTIQSLKRYCRQHNYHMNEFLQEFAELQALLEAPKQGVLSNLLEAPVTAQLPFNAIPDQNQDEVA